MFTAKEFAAENKVPEVLSNEMAEFAMFTIDLPGSNIPLWDVVPVATMSMCEMRKLQAKEAELDRLANLERYIARGYAFEENVDN